MLSRHLTESQPPCKKLSENHDSSRPARAPQLHSRADDHDTHAGLHSHPSRVVLHGDDCPAFQTGDERTAHLRGFLFEILVRLTFVVGISHTFEIRVPDRQV